MQFKSDPNLVTELQPNQVFVFGSNEAGAHTGGAAGVAFWLDTHLPLHKPLQNEIGKWSVFGVARGLQRGYEGQSWGIVTIKRPGQLCSTDICDIYDQVVELVEYANQHPELEFLITPIAEGYAGYDRDDMSNVWECINDNHGIPNNFTFVGRDWNAY